MILATSWVRTVRLHHNHSYQIFLIEWKIKDIFGKILVIFDTFLGFFNEFAAILQSPMLPECHFDPPANQAVHNANINSCTAKWKIAPNGPEKSQNQQCFIMQKSHFYNTVRIILFLFKQLVGTSYIYLRQWTSL